MCQHLLHLLLLQLLHQVPTPTPAPASVPTPIQVSLDYFGIKSTHQPAIYVARNKVQLHALVDDGKTTKKFSYPSSNAGIDMEDFNLEDLRRQTIFYTPSVGDYLRISILAYSCEDKETILEMWKAMEAFEPGVSPLREFYENLPQKKELIGCYEHTWYPIEKWGVATDQYEEENGDLLVWFRIWSDVEPAPVPKPSLLPDVRIQDVSISPQIKQWTWASHALSILNNEGCEVPVTWQAHSSVTGNFASESVAVPRHNQISIKRSYLYDRIGPVNITYTLLFRGAKLDTWSGTVVVVP